MSLEEVLLAFFRYVLELVFLEQRALVLRELMSQFFKYVDSERQENANSFRSLESLESGLVLHFYLRHIPQVSKRTIRPP